MNRANALSVCIPSYNRGKLKRCLDNVIPAAKKYNWPVYVSDNYEGEAFDISAYDYANLYYSQNDHNIGADLNMFRVLRQAGTKFALWLGDDDVLDLSKVSTIVRYLEHMPDLLMLSEEWDKQICFEDVKNFYTQYEPNPIYFGNCIVRTDCLSTFDESKYLNSAPLHVYNIYINYYLSKLEDTRNHIHIVIDNSSVIMRNRGGAELGKKVISK